MCVCVCVATYDYRTETYVPFEMSSHVGSVSTIDVGGEGTGEIVFSFDGIMISDKLSDELEVSNSGS